MSKPKVVLCLLSGAVRSRIIGVKKVLITSRYNNGALPFQIHRNGVTWCSPGGGYQMRAKKENGKKVELRTVRASISFPRDIYSTLEGIAQQKKVSVAWVVRDAAEKYIAEKWPLFAKEEHSL